ncbi:MAG: GlsB/YeaQ/YmgE family stress response membrane protein [Ignavibacteriales bacterium]|nr:GlsB/YeaQ/YmgE family stress response membrane protein [Ignavibacteriales bacterium]MBP9120143.1 GlsB/YeaQ/YmgE family stress response membrane protein [Ignavibacterium sp.]
MEIIGTIIIGFIAGVIAKLLMPGKDPGGCIITILLGIVGAFIATYLGKILGIYEPGETAGFIGATLGAMLVLFLYRIILKKK